ncbi:50S ribosomal protein L10 [Thermosynechococcus sichuanensis E542]|uniref:Large ribosomal subunit protein uL10 n=1 Tax=Thermosynechococcus sichuanensis E542 TaxID=2016101 RepID=A0A3B7MGF8_9CYAN|nr:50S ribosomal protein L10 [Thermosynechococcus vestitus]AXY68708.1 50S ribosomal protein L10 [Thermosynechococcus vestitus E542]
MGRTLANKKEIVAELKARLSESQMALVIDYQGLTDAEMKDLRQRLRQCNASCKVTKNTLMELAVKESDTWQPMTQFLKGPSAFLLVKDDIGGAIKAYQEFQKATKKTTLRGGVMEGRALDEAQVKAIGDLPSKEQLMAQIAGALNAVTAKIAIGIKEVPASLARATQAIADKGAA